MILAEIIEGKKEALKPEEVAQILGVSLKQIYRLAKKGQLPSLKVASSVRFDPHDVATWIRTRSTAPVIRAGSVVSTHLSRQKTIHQAKQNRQI